MKFGKFGILFFCLFFTATSGSLRDRLAAIKNRKKAKTPKCEDCEYVYGPCSKSCGPGVQLPRLVKANNCGTCKAPPPKPCMRKTCPVECNWTSWSAFSSCSRSCGGGKMSRSREMSNPSGGCQGDPTEERSCNEICCSDECPWSEWSEIGSCSQSCGGGIQNRTRRMLVGSSCKSGRCPPREDQFGSVPCNEEECVDVSWSEWGSCSEVCGGGEQIRSRNRVDPVSGKIGKMNETRRCNEHCCPVDCQWTEWGQWSGCNATCGVGQRNRVRDVIANATCGGRPCAGQSLVHEDCAGPCCPSDCEVSPWSPWTSCTASCGPDGQRNRTRHVTKKETCGGRCGHELTERSRCNTDCCPVDCEMSPWSAWTSCSSSCGFGGQQTRGRNVTRQSVCGGMQCADERMQRRVCNEICMNDGVMVDASCRCPSTWKGECCEQDVDECEIHGNEICHESGECVNVENGFQCRCHPGYRGDGFNCTDINECDDDDSHGCDSNSECRNSEGSFACVCNPGYYGDGHDCQAQNNTHDNMQHRNSDQQQQDAPTFIIICAVIITICVVIAIIAFLKYRYRRIFKRKGTYLIGSSRVHYTRKVSTSNNKQDENVQGIGQSHQ